MSTRSIKQFFSGGTGLLLLISILGLPFGARAQEAAATVTGVIYDSSGAVIPKATIALKNVNTAVVRTSASNSTGNYTFLNVTPGVYSVTATATGFSTVNQAAVTLEVNQTVTFDFHLQPGGSNQTVNVQAEGAQLETSTAELGTVVNNREVDDLPLNGRNFTQLLTITAGVSTVNRGQSQYGGAGWAGNSIGNFSFPAVNGANNRSNFFILDGVNDLNTMLTMYNVQPIVDDIQEFKTQGHNDLAEYGGAVGGIISVVSKSGTNEYHATLWEFLRNEKLDARGYFEANRAPLRQNQFGASGGGPVIIPKLYNGRNRTFFYAAFEEYRYRSSSEGGFLGPTTAMRAGDFSALCTAGFVNGVCSNPSQQLYNPYTTTCDAGSGTCSRQPFLNNNVAAEINPISTAFQSLIPTAGPLVNGANIYAPGRNQTNQITGSIRVDQYFGNKNQLFFRYSQYDQTVANSTNVIGTSDIHPFGHNYVVHETHTFSPTSISEVYFGRNYGDTVTGNLYPSDSAAFTGQLLQDGMSKYFMTLNNQLYAPQWTVNGYIGLNGPQLQETELSDVWQFGGNFTKIFGRHSLKIGGDFQTNNFRSPIAYSQETFDPAQTAGLGAQQGLGGNGWASMLIGVPASANYRNLLETLHGGWIDGVYIEDQWKATDRLAVNLGFRDDIVITPIYGTGNGNNFYTGEVNPLTGKYILNAMPPACSATQGAPCIPNGTFNSSGVIAPGTLPSYITVTPFANNRMIKNSPTDWAPRVGLAYRIGDKTSLRAAYTRFYDAWSSIIQLSQDISGNWPAVATVYSPTGMNADLPTSPSSDPLGLGSSGSIVYPAATPIAVSQSGTDPNFRTPYMDQWNAGVQRELPFRMLLDVNYVGSVGRHLDWAPTFNYAQPGPGPSDPTSLAARRPFSYLPTIGMDTSTGNSRYNALQITLNKQTSRGVTFLVTYTRSDLKDNSCGLGSPCHATDSYTHADYGISDQNQPNAFTASFTLQSPLSNAHNRWESNIAGGWAFNGIVQFRSGLPYAVTANGAILNNGGVGEERANVTGNPNGGSSRTLNQWFNPSAFAAPAAYTYGNEPINYLSSQFSKNFDASLFRRFPLGLGENRFLEFRLEAFNLFNNVVFSPPNSTIGQTNYDVVTGQANGARQLQAALKLYF